MNTKEVFFKALTLDSTPVEGQRDFEASLSWEGSTAVRTAFGKTYIEVLLHDEASVDLTRLGSDGSIPLLFDHDHKVRIGKALNVKLDPVEKKLRATVRIGKSAKALDLLADVQDGTFTDMSIGYFVKQNDVTFKTIDGTLYGFSKWTPYECSLTPVAEDVTVGIGKSLDMSTVALTPEDSIEDAVEDAKEEEEACTTCETCSDMPCTCVSEDATTIKVSVEVEVTLPVTEEIEPNSDLLEDEEKEVDQKSTHHHKSITTKEITMEDIKQEITIPGNADFGKNGLAKYSVAAHIKGLMIGSLTGVEREVAQELGSSNIIPTAAFAKAQFNTVDSTSGSEFNILKFGGFLDLLLPGSIFSKLGCCATLALDGPITLPGADTPVYTAVNEKTGGATQGAITTRNILFDAKIAVAQFKMSNKSLIQSQAGLESYLKSLILQRQKYDFEYKALKQIIGEITNSVTIGTTNVVSADGSDAASLLGIVKAVTSVIDLPVNGSFLTDWTMLHKLQGIKKSTSLVDAVATADSIWNYPAAATALLLASDFAAKDPIVYGDWSRCQLASFGPGVEIIVDNITDAINANTVITAQSYWDGHITDTKAFAKAVNAT